MEEPGKANAREVMQIGEIAARAGISVRAVRYYEELGLIRPESHSQGGFRLYGPESLKRLTVINFLKDLGLPLLEIRSILGAKKAAGADRETVSFLLEVFTAKLAALDDRIARLEEMRGELRRSVGILETCRKCGHKVLLDAGGCRDCAGLLPREKVPDTIDVILQ